MPTVHALIHRENGVSGISFPDFPGVVATGRSTAQAIQRGVEALTFHVAGMIEDDDPLPRLRDIDELERDPEFLEDSEGARVVVVSIDLPSKTTRVNVSIEESLLGAIDRAAKARGQTRSGYLAEAARMRIRSE